MEPIEDETNYAIRGLLSESDSLLPGMEAEASVAPAPTPVSHASNLYPEVPPTMDNCNQEQVNPTGFEMHDDLHLIDYSEDPDIELISFIRIPTDVTQDTGPTEVISEKVPLEQKGNPKDEDTMYFNDGVRRIDYVLAFDPEGAVRRIDYVLAFDREGAATKDNRKNKREYFEKELERNGLQLEREEIEKSKSGKVAFVKIHAPWDVLAKGAELVNMKMPLAPNDMGFEASSILNCIPTPFDLDSDIMEDDDNYFTAPFNRNRMEQFVIKDKEKFFSNAQRSRIVNAILSSCFYEDEDPSKPTDRRFGIKKLLANSTYSAAYPLHDGKFISKHSLLRGKLNDRRLLYEVWARPRAWYKYQPLDKIRNYFGEKVGIYFAWLGYYTMMLIPASIVGLVAFIYGCVTIFDDVLSNEICSLDKAGNMTMCPLCDGRCSYWKLVDSCAYSRATYLFDNPATVAFACFMALWASFFHEVWKRKEAELGYDWDVADFEQEEETVRPEFENKVRRKRENPINKKQEPFVPNSSKCMRYFTTVSVIMFFLCLVIAALFGVMLYRIIIAAVFYASENSLLRQRATLATSSTAACINCVIIEFLNFIYKRIAEGLTEIEHHRTFTEWEDAFTFKMFLFQFVNVYSPILYIAFFQGRFVGRPGDYNYNLLNYRQEECDPAGCLIDLCIQLAIVMIGKQIFSNFKEIILPKLMVWFKSRSVNQDKEDKVYTHWEQDYNLAELPKLGLFDEYLEMVIQYGFVTIFVAAFPLAPLFALINNVIEIRLDAYKFVTQWRRPMAVRAQDIGIWFGILQGISAIAVISNACIIAFTSEFIPRTVYKYGYSPDQSLEGYFQNFSMAEFNVYDFQEQSVPNDNKSEIHGNVSICLYRGFRADAGADREYEYTMAFWHVFAGRLAFIVVFENTIVFLSWLIMYLVPDIAYAVKMQMLREKYLSKQALFHAEVIREVSRESARRVVGNTSEGYKIM